MKTIDSIQPPARNTPRPEPQKQTREARGTGARFTAFASTPKRRRAWGVLLTLLLSPILFGLAFAGIVGVVPVVFYGIIVLARRWPSRMPLSLALMALLYMVGLQLADAPDLAQSMAVLAYVLLTMGAISLALEVKMSSRVWFKKH